MRKEMRHHSVDAAKDIRGATLVFAGAVTRREDRGNLIRSRRRPIRSFVGISIVFGLALMTMIYAGGEVSGARINLAQKRCDLTRTSR